MDKETKSKSSGKITIRSQIKDMVKTDREKLKTKEFLRQIRIKSRKEKIQKKTFETINNLLDAIKIEDARGESTFFKQLCVKTLLVLTFGISSLRG